MQNDTIGLSANKLFILMLALGGVLLVASANW